MEAADGSNMTYFTTVSERLGYQVAVRIFKAIDFYMPQSRRRAFGICADVEQSETTPEEVKIMLESMMQLAESMANKSKMFSVESLLLKPGDPYLCSETRRLQEVRDKNLEASDPADMEWRPLLSEMCKRKAIVTTTPIIIHGFVSRESQTCCT